MTNDFPIALRGCLQSLSGVPCRISRIGGKKNVPQILRQTVS